jgi:hypothetical protein
VNVFNYCSKHVGVSGWLHAVTKIKNVSRVSAVVGKHGIGAGKRGCSVAKNEFGVQVSLHDGVCTKPASRIGN